LISCTQRDRISFGTISDDNAVLIETTDVLVQLKELFRGYLSRVKCHQTILNADIIQGSTRKSRLWIAAKEIERIIIEVTAYACWVRLGVIYQRFGHYGLTGGGQNPSQIGRAHV